MRLLYENKTGLHEIDINELMATLEGFFGMPIKVDKTAEEWLLGFLEINYNQNKVLFKEGQKVAGKEHKTATAVIKCPYCNRKIWWGNAKHSNCGHVQSQYISSGIIDTHKHYITIFKKFKQEASNDTNC